MPHIDPQYIVFAIGLGLGLLTHLWNRGEKAEKDIEAGRNASITSTLASLTQTLDGFKVQTDNTFKSFREQSDKSAKESNDFFNRLNLTVERLGFSVDHMSKDGVDRHAAVVQSCKTNEFEITRIRDHIHKEMDAQIQSHEFHLGAVDGRLDKIEKRLEPQH